MSAPDPQQREAMTFWSRLAQDIGDLKHDLGELRREMKEDLIRLAASKTDVSVSEGRWKDVQQDIADMKADIRQLQQQPVQQQQQVQQQIYNQKILTTNQQVAMATIISVAVGVVLFLLQHVRFQ